MAKPRNPGLKSAPRRAGRGGARSPARPGAVRAAAGRGRAGRRAAARPARAAPRRPAGATDPDGFLVARIGGEDAVREAPHPLAEGASDTGGRVPEGVGRALAAEERLGELPWGYGDDAFVALPRDPRSLFLYWDHAEETLRRGFEGLDGARAHLWLFRRRGPGWERARVVELALESRGYYLHDLEPGALYRAEIHLVDRAGREKLLGHPSSEAALPPAGPSPVVDDRFLRIPWEQRLGPLLGTGHPGPDLSDGAREALAGLRRGSASSPGRGWASGGGRGP
ncbi:MAG TPA: DUF4912 domain-containing protein [Anaeromyxobacter sp.]|nr:DUF4912 domain-containing protein [Anaeromyxobacter sp.]